MTNQSGMTWGMTALWTLAAFIPSTLAAFWLARQNVALLPPLGAATPFFYLGVIVSLPLGVFLVCAWQRPAGGPARLLVALAAAGAALCFNLALLGPMLAGGVPVECQTAEESGSVVHLRCQCAGLWLNPEMPHGPCAGDQRWGLPLIWNKHLGAP